jgi:hypothetical protein
MKMCMEIKNISAKVEAKASHAAGWPNHHKMMGTLHTLAMTFAECSDGGCCEAQRLQHELGLAQVADDPSAL